MLRLTNATLGECRCDELCRVVRSGAAPVDGIVARTAPLVVRFDARSRKAEIAARALRGRLRAWGYRDTVVKRGLHAC